MDRLPLIDKDVLERAKARLGIASFTEHSLELKRKSGNGDATREAESAAAEATNAAAIEEAKRTEQEIKARLEKEHRLAELTKMAEANIEAIKARTEQARAATEQARYSSMITSRPVSPRQLAKQQADYAAARAAAKPQR
jgi:hypothetical protein